jgi:hypothetical protein
MKIKHILFCLMLSGCLYSCEEKSKGEKFKDALEDKADKAEDKLEEAGEDAEKKAKELKKKAE